MDAELNIRVKYELNSLLNDREIYLRRLSRCKEYESYKLKKSKHANGSVFYCGKSPSDSKFRYLGKQNNQTVQMIQEAHYLSEALARVDHNIKLLSSLIDNYLPVDIASINAALPKAYSSTVFPCDLPYQQVGEEWKEKMLFFQSQHPENYPERKTNITSDGVRVKTISEVVLYERLLSAGLYVIYELPLALDDYGPNIYPDFTVLSPIDMKSSIIIEYVGLLSNSVYREAFFERVRRYIRNGYIPGVNLFFVFGDKDGHIDSMQINRIIADIKGI